MIFMTKLNQIYRCSVCGNMVEVVNEGAGTLVCCGKPMDFQEAKASDEGMEKHVPVIEQKDGKLVVTVGSTLHPMEENHYIQWIELMVDGKVYRQYLKPGDQPQATFVVTGQQISAREYCNVHGLWEARS